MACFVAKAPAGYQPEQEDEDEDTDWSEEEDPAATMKMEEDAS